MPTPELPQLREQLVDAAAALPRRRRRARLGAVAAGLVAAGLVALVVLLGGGRAGDLLGEREGPAATATPAAPRTIREAYAVLRRPATPRDRLQLKVGFLGAPASARILRIRQVGSVGSTRAFLVELTRPSRLCSIVRTGPALGTSGCLTPAEAIGTRRGTGTYIGNAGGPKTFVRSFPDSVRSAVLDLADGRTERVPVVDNAVVVRTAVKPIALRWRDPGGALRSEPYEPVFPAGLPVGAPPAALAGRTVLVANAEAPAGKAGTYAARLDAVGWRTETIDAPERAVGSSVVARAADEQLAQAIAARLHLGQVRVPTRLEAGLLRPSAPVMLLIGPDF